MSEDTESEGSDNQLDARASAEAKRAVELEADQNGIKPTIAVDPAATMAIAGADPNMLAAKAAVDIARQAAEALKNKGSRSSSMTGLGNSPKPRGPGSTSDQAETINDDIKTLRDVATNAGKNLLQLASPEEAPRVDAPVASAAPPVGGGAALAAGTGGAASEAELARDAARSPMSLPSPRAIPNPLDKKR